MAYRDDEPWRLPPSIKGENFRLSRGVQRPLSAETKARLRRIVNRVPEVMVKVTGRTRGSDGGHLKAHLDYITRNGRVHAETQDGEVITERGRLRELHEDWLLANATQARGRVTPRSAQSVNLILSMPAGSPPDRVQAASRTWARDTFGNKYDWVMARHDDTDHSHVHITVRAVGSDGLRLTPGPADLQQWRERFARELRRLGVEAEATPRQARGAVRKKPPSAIHHNVQRGSEPEVHLLQQRDAHDDIHAPKRRARDWDADIQARQHSIRRSYLGHAHTLSKGDAADRQLGRDIRRFVDDMPLALTRRQAIAVELRRVLEQRAERIAPVPATPFSPSKRAIRV